MWTISGARYVSFLERRESGTFRLQFWSNAAIASLISNFLSHLNNFKYFPSHQKCVPASYLIGQNLTKTRLAPSCIFDEY